MNHVRIDLGIYACENVYNMRRSLVNQSTYILRWCVHRLLQQHLPHSTQTDRYIDRQTDTHKLPTWGIRSDDGRAVAVRELTESRAKVLH